VTAALTGRPVLVIGAGVMGMGIAQVAAQAGHAVMLYDAFDGAAAKGKARLASSLNTLVAKGKMAEAAAADILAKIEVITALQSAASAGLVVEAIVEQLAAKRGLFQQLEAVVAADCVLATNTSSISVTAIANGLQHPGRLVGMHFFNPVPLMRLVEVVSGLQTDAEVADRVFALSQAWARWLCMRAPPPASSSTASPGLTTPKRWRCCRSRPPRQRCWTPVCAAPASAWAPVN